MAKFSRKREEHSLPSINVFNDNLLSKSTRFLEGEPLIKIGLLLSCHAFSAEDNKNHC